MTDPWSTPAAIPSEFPTVASLRGRLVLIKPLKQETVPNNQGAPGATQERVTANVTVVDGLGPIPVMSRGVPTGQLLAGPDFNGMWIAAEVIVKQLAEALQTRGAVLARVNTPDPNAAPGKGNAWGLIHPTEQDKQIARDYLAGRTVGAAAAPAAQPVAQQAYQPQVQQPANPFAAPAQPGPPPSTGVNPFAPQQ
jgi:hypothetical protein